MDSWTTGLLVRSHSSMSIIGVGPSVAHDSSRNEKIPFVAVCCSSSFTSHLPISTISATFNVSESISTSISDVAVRSPLGYHHSWDFTRTYHLVNLISTTITAHIGGSEINTGTMRIFDHYRTNYRGTKVTVKSNDAYQKNVEHAIQSLAF